MRRKKNRPIFRSQESIFLHNISYLNIFDVKGYFSISVHLHAITQRASVREELKERQNRDWETNGKIWNQCPLINGIIIYTYIFMFSSAICQIRLFLFSHYAVCMCVHWSFSLPSSFSVHIYACLCLSEWQNWFANEWRQLVLTMIKKKSKTQNWYVFYWAD